MKDPREDERPTRSRNTLGYTQFMAASRDGSRSVVVSVNRQTSPTEFPQVFAALREVDRLAVCAAVGDGPLV